MGVGGLFVCLFTGEVVISLDMSTQLKTRWYHQSLCYDRGEWECQTLYLKKVRPFSHHERRQISLPIPPLSPLSPRKDSKNLYGKDLLLLSYADIDGDHSRISRKQIIMTQSQKELFVLRNKDKIHKKTRSMKRLWLAAIQSCPLQTVGWVQGE